MPWGQHEAAEDILVGSEQDVARIVARLLDEHAGQATEIVGEGAAGLPAKFAFPGKGVDPKTYDATYHTDLKTTGVPFLGPAMLKDAFVSALTVIVVVALAAIAGPKGPTAPPDPALGGANPRPEWRTMWRRFVSRCAVARINPAVGRCST